MKRFQLTSIILFFLLALSSCNNQDPVACFAIPSRLEINEEYKFKDCSVNVQEYQWDFGDGSTSELPSPAHTYTDEGTYIVVLRTKNKKKLDELTRTISTWLNDLTSTSEGSYSGNYLEEYPDSVVLNKEYTGSLNVKPLTNKSINVLFSRGSFQAIVVGQMDTGFVFTEVTNLEPARLDLITSGNGSFSLKNKTFTFTLSGKDPSLDSLNWTINYSGTLK